MNILYLIDNFSLGGAQTIVRGLMEQDGIKFRKYAVALRQKHPEMHISHPDVLTFPSRSRYSFRVLRYLKVFITEKEIGTVHCQLPRSILMGYFLKRAFPQIRYIIHEQGDVFESRTYAMLLKILQKKADGILACSQATANVLNQRVRLDPGRIFVLYNFVDTVRFAPCSSTPFPIRRIAFAGRIEKRKGWREFVKAAGCFRDREELCFYLAGTGTEVKKLLRAIRKQKGACIRFVGFREDIHAFYAEMDLLVIPSHFEPMGMVAIEAMACGLPVLAADVPGLNEIVCNGENGWTYPSGSVNALTGALDNIMAASQDLIQRIVAVGRDRALEFSIREFSHTLQHYYESIPGPL